MFPPGCQNCLTSTTTLCCRNIEDTGSTYHSVSLDALQQLKWKHYLTLIIYSHYFPSHPPTHNNKILLETQKDKNFTDNITEHKITWWPQSTKLSHIGYFLSNQLQYLFKCTQKEKYKNSWLDINQCKTILLAERVVQWRVGSSTSN